MKTSQVLLTALILLIVSCSACKNGDDTPDPDPQLRNVITFKIAENGGDAQDYAIFEAIMGVYNGALSAYVEGQPRVLTMAGGTTDGTYAFSIALPDVGKDVVGTYAITRDGVGEGNVTWTISKALEGGTGVLSMIGTAGQLEITGATNDGELMRISGTFSFTGTNADGGTFSITNGVIDRLPVRKAQ